MTSFSTFSPFYIVRIFLKFNNNGTTTTQEQRGKWCKNHQLPKKWKTLKKYNGSYTWNMKSGLFPKTGSLFGQLIEHFSNKKGIFGTNFVWSFSLHLPLLLRFLAIRTHLVLVQENRPVEKALRFFLCVCCKQTRHIEANVPEKSLWVA